MIAFLAYATLACCNLFWLTWPIPDLLCNRHLWHWEMTLLKKKD